MTANQSPGGTAGPWLMLHLMTGVRRRFPVSGSIEVLKDNLSGVSMTSGRTGPFEQGREVFGPYTEQTQMPLTESDEAAG